jgi:hypothetical protein
MPRVVVTGAVGFVWKGEIAVPGQVLDCSEREAHALVNGYGTATYLDEPAPTRPGMMVNADPVAEHRDPEPAKPIKRSRK